MYEPSNCGWEQLLQRLQGFNQGECDAVGLDLRVMMQFEESVPEKQNTTPPKPRQRRRPKDPYQIHYRGMKNPKEWTVTFDGRTVAIWNSKPLYYLSMNGWVIVECPKCKKTVEAHCVHIQIHTDKCQAKWKCTDRYCQFC